LVKPEGEILPMSHAQTPSLLSPDAALTALGVVDTLLEQMIHQQRGKVLRLAREAIPYLSPEDVMNPNDFPELKAHPTFDFEDGILSGLVSAQVAVRAELKGMLPVLPQFIPSS
jgi:hypothetical protein